MAYLRLYQGNTLQRQWKVDSDRLTIGRSTKCDIVLNSPGVSKQHAVISCGGHSVVVIDHDSANGIFVNGRRVRRHVLKYWDEVQIVNYVIQFMASARLPGEQLGMDEVQPSKDPDATREIDISSIKDLKKLQRDDRVPHLYPTNRGNTDSRVTLNNVNFSIGGSKGCDMRLKGWFIPKSVARIQRRANGFFLLRDGRGRISVNDRRINRETEIKDNDQLAIHRQQFRFYFRPISR